ncbi:FxsB family cyclophane-forming radical SAM/SPASM peptide maturase [Catellatospora paridis]|uniref:FxsB family cyclophane-forming radical SAM/SPASM peptide maturase n=1 Tax=Catellatospora paridis TaxID=1617086 RepID=UPI0012D48CA6|nr:FxsB family cyclophane-forming radical SAM/SPASM peptide maturase [Catellatospora paridis]
MPAASATSRLWTLSQFVLKVHSRCDLACDHCYMYEHADQSWQRRPRAMSPETLRVTAERIAEHAAAHRLHSVRVVIHGGEPLLLGPATLGERLAGLRAAIDPVTKLDLRMQTNGVLLSEAFCEVLAEHDVMVGVSLDGDRAANDLHRRYANGASSYDKVRNALALLRRPEYRRLYAGILCTIDVRADPIAVYEALLAEEPPRLDLLLPHATWDAPPLRPDGDRTPYATWLRRIYDRWTADGRPVPIRMFDSVLSTAVGGPSGGEQLGLDPVDLAVVETDGEWEQGDSLKIAFEGGPATGLTVFTHSVDEVAVLPEIVRRQGGVEQLSAECQACPVVRQCGGGLFAHRYRTGSGFDNPSVFCADLKEFIQIMNTSVAPAAGSAAALSGADPLSELIDQIGSGFGDEATMLELADTQLLMTLKLLKRVADAGPHPYAGEGWKVLQWLDGEHPEAVGAVLAHPYVRAWAVRCLTAREETAPAAMALAPRGGTGRDDAGYLNSLAAAAALRAGLETELQVPVFAGRVHLPTVGTGYLPSPAGDVARLSSTGRGFILRAGTVEVDIDDIATAGLAWQPARLLETAGLAVLIEDGDPYRDCHQWTPAERISAAEDLCWREHLTQAWRLIRDDAAEYVPGLQLGLRTVAPLVAEPGGLMRASTSRDAFGSVASVLAEPAELAVILVHEFQHGKLGALLDMCELLDPRRTERFVIPWRADPRPLEGVLQGTYAHIAVADMWRRRADQSAKAREHYLDYRAWSEAGLDVLLRSGALTAPGARLVEAMARAVAGWAV